MLQITPLKELQDRVSNLQYRLQEKSLDGALITQKMDLYYFAGSMQNGFLFVPVGQAPLYMVRRNYNRALKESGWKKVIPLKNWGQLSAYLQEYLQGSLKTIGLELDVLPVNQYKQLLQIFPGVKFVDISTMIREIRMLKSEYELNCFRRADKIATDIFREIPALLEVGKSEIELAAEIETLYRKAGHQGILRMRGFNMEMLFGHAYFGENGEMSTFLDSCTGGEGVTTACPQGSGWRKLNPHEPVGLDYGSVYGGYILDHTRVFSLGSLPPELEKAYDVALDIQQEVISRAAPGILSSELYRLALEIATARGLGDFFMGYKDRKVKFIGHGVGLDLDEFPLLSQVSKHVLYPGMVFALEPKFIFPGKGMLGLENVWHVTEKSVEKITSMPDDLVIVPLK